MGRLAATRRFDEVKIGDELPELAIDVTPTLIISTAIASRDYQDVHHDVELAKSRGAKSIFMNILTTNGIVGRYVSDWAGPEALFKSVSIRLGVPNYPGDTMKLTGKVQAKSDADGVVDLAIQGANRLGNHVVGTVRVALPKRA